MRTSPRHLAALAMALCAGACAAPPGPAVEEAASAIALKNPGFEQDPVPGGNCAPQWGCSAHSDAGSFRYTVDGSGAASGQRSLRVERVRNEPWGLITQAVHDPKLRGARLRFSLAVRTEGASGNGGGVFYAAQGPGGVTIAHQQKLTPGTSGWSRIAVEFVVPAAANLFEVGAILEGPGTLWIDDARLEVLEPASAGKKPV